jgi:hypothetical protein
MQPLEQFLVNEHIRELRREADAERLAGANRLLRRRAAAWRRHGGAVARWLSRTAGDVAVTLDPTLCLPSYGRE